GEDFDAAARSAILSGQAGGQEPELGDVFDGREGERDSACIRAGQACALEQNVLASDRPAEYAALDRPIGDAGQILNEDFRIAVTTVDEQRRILKKLGLHERSDLARRALGQRIPGAREAFGLLRRLQVEIQHVTCGDVDAKVDYARYARSVLRRNCVQARVEGGKGIGSDGRRYGPVFP